MSSSACARRVSSNPMVTQLSSRGCADQYIDLEQCRCLPASRSNRKSCPTDLRPMRSPLLSVVAALLAMAVPAGAKARRMLDQMIIKKWSVRCRWTLTNPARPLHPA